MEIETESSKKRFNDTYIRLKSENKELQEINKLYERALQKGEKGELVNIISKEPDIESYRYNENRRIQQETEKQRKELKRLEEIKKNPLYLEAKKEYDIKMKVNESNKEDRNKLLEKIKRFGVQLEPEDDDGNILDTVYDLLTSEKMELLDKPKIRIY